MTYMTQSVADELIGFDENEEGKTSSNERLRDLGGREGVSKGDEPQLPIFSHNRYLAWPQAPQSPQRDGEPSLPALPPTRAAYTTLSDVLTRHEHVDAHFAAYSNPEVPYRLSTAAMSEVSGGVRMSLLAIDVDSSSAHSEKTLATDDWRAGERMKLERLLERHPGAFVYDTRGGYRIVYTLASPFLVTDAVTKEEWTRMYLAACVYLAAEFEIFADPACADWTRLYRIPHATRESCQSPENRPVIGDPSAVASFAMPAATASMIAAAKALVAALPNEKTRTAWNRVWKTFDVSVKKSRKKFTQPKSSNTSHVAARPDEELATALRALDGASIVHDRVRVRCHMHDDANPSAVVFLHEARLYCSSCNTSWSASEWLTHPTWCERLGDELVERVRPRTLDELLNSIVPTQSKTDVEVTLRLLRDNDDLRALDDLGRQFVRERLVKALKEHGSFKAAAKLADASLRPKLASTDPESLFPNVEPWPEAVDDVGEVLGELSCIAMDCLSLPQHGETVLALWAAHTFALDAAKFSPRIVLSSPTPRCGKTRTLELLKSVASRPAMAVSISPAAIYRLVEREAPTLLVDEADTIFRAGNAEELRAVVNSGYDRAGGAAIRCDPETYEPRAYRCFSPLALSLIGRSLPPSLIDRSIVLPMQRKPDSIQLSKLDDSKKAALAIVAQKLARWASDNMTALEKARPFLPSELNDRASDIWSPLLAIAEAAGGDWPIYAQDAAIAFSAAKRSSDHANERLIGLVLGVFERDPAKREMSCDEVVQLLSKDPAFDWVEEFRGREVEARHVNRVLRAFEVEVFQYRAANGQGRRDRGVRRTDIVRVASAYGIEPIDPPAEHVIAGGKP